MFLILYSKGSVLMIKVNSLDRNIYALNNYTTNPIFKGNNENAKTETKSVDKLPDVTLDFNVKKPISYVKTDEIKLPQGLTAHCYKLANGQKVVIVPKDEGATIIKTYVQTGSMNETDNIRGISHFIEHNFFNGSDGLEAGEFFKKVDKMGAYTNAATGMAETNYYIKSNLLNDSDLEEQIKMHASMMQYPKFLPEMLEKEKLIVNSEINMITSDPENLGIQTVIKNLYDINTKSADLIGGTTDNITNLTREDVVNYFNQNYYPANLTTVITGDVDEKEAINLIAKNFTSMKKPPENRYFEPLNPIQMPVRQDVISPKTKGTLIYAAFNGPKADNNEDKIKMAALCMILSNMKSSRLDERLKEFGTGVGIFDEKISSKNDGEVATLFASKTNEKNSEKVLKVLFEEIEKIKNNPPSKEEMEIVKKQLLLNFSQAFEFSEEVNALVGEAVTSGGFGEITDFKKIVKNMTAEDLAETAKKYLDLNKVSLMVIHPKSATPESIKENYEEAHQLSFGRANTVIKKSNMEQYILPNNIDIVTNENPSDRCTMELAINLPPDFRTKENIGAAMILRELFNKGTMDKDQKTYINELQKSGISMSIFGGNGLTFIAQFEPENLDKTVNAMQEVYYEPRLTEEEFEQVKKDLKNAISIYKTKTSDLVKTYLFRGDVDGMTPREIINAIDKTTLDDVMDLHAKFIEEASAAVAISAPFKENSDLKNNIFGKLNEFDEFKPWEFQVKENYKPNETTRIFVVPENTNQAKILETFTYKKSFNVKDIAAITLMNNILGGSSSSRLFSDLRETRKLCYNVQSDIKGIGDTEMINLSIKTTTDNKDTGEVSYDNVQKAIDGFNENIQKMVNEKVSEEELESAKLSLKNILLSSSEGGLKKTVHIMGGLEGSYYGPDYVNQLFNAIDEITVDDIQRAAQYVFANKPIYAICATKDTLAYNKDYLKDLKNQ